MTSGKSIILGLIVGSCSLAPQAFAVDRCAVYGPDFASVEGSQACVKIGGHVRVEIQTRSAGTADQDWRGGTAPTAMRTVAPLGSDGSDDPGMHHLRLPPQDDAADYDGAYLR